MAVALPVLAAEEAESSGEVGEKGCGIAIVFIEGVPADRHVHIAGKIDQQCGFAIASGRANKCQLAVHILMD